MQVASLVVSIHLNVKCTVDVNLNIKNLINNGDYIDDLIYVCLCLDLFVTNFFFSDTNLISRNHNSFTYALPLCEKYK